MLWNNFTSWQVVSREYLPKSSRPHSYIVLLYSLINELIIYGMAGHIPHQAPQHCKLYCLIDCVRDINDLCVIYRMQEESPKVKVTGPLVCKQSQSQKGTRCNATVWVTSKVQEVKFPNMSPSSDMVIHWIGDQKDGNQDWHVPRVRFSKNREALLRYGAISQRSTIGKILGTANEDNTFSRWKHHLWGSLVACQVQLCFR